MHLRRPPTAFFFVVSVLLAGLLVGCGGGDQSGSGGSQGGDGQQQGEAQQGEAQQGGAGEQGQAAQGDPPEVKIALGRVIAVVPDRRKIILRPSAEVQGGERMSFKVRDDAEIGDVSAKLLGGCRERVAVRGNTPCAPRCNARPGRPDGFRGRLPPP